MQIASGIETALWASDLRIVHEERHARRSSSDHRRAPRRRYALVRRHARRAGHAHRRRDLGSGKQSPLAVSYTRFERGWLKSEAVSRIAVKADPSIYFEVRHEISHMPNRAGWVRVHSVPQLSGVVKANLDYYFGGQPPIAVDTVVGYDGTHVMQF
jgi:hypothetical protein